MSQDDVITRGLGRHCRYTVKRGNTTVGLLYKLRVRMHLISSLNMCLLHPIFSHITKPQNLRPLTICQALSSYV